MIIPLKLTRSNNENELSVQDYKCYSHYSKSKVIIYSDLYNCRKVSIYDLKNELIVVNLYLS